MGKLYISRDDLREVDKSEVYEIAPFLPEELGIILRKRRAELGLTQEETSARIGLTHGAFGRAETRGIFQVATARWYLSALGLEPFIMVRHLPEVG